MCETVFGGKSGPEWISPVTTVTRSGSTVRPRCCHVKHLFRIRLSVTHQTCFEHYCEICSTPSRIKEHCGLHRFFISGDFASSAVPVDCNVCIMRVQQQTTHSTRRRHHLERSLGVTTLHRP